MEHQLIDTVAMENGLTLELVDASRKIASDRWQVKLIARIRVEVRRKWFGQNLDPPAEMDRVRAKLGETQCYEYQLERNFVDQKDKPAILDNLVGGVMAKKTYYSRPDFPGRFLIKAYADRQAYPAGAQPIK